MLTRHAEVIDSALDDAEKDIRTVVEREWKGDASGKYLDSWTLMRLKADQIVALLQEFAQEAQKVKRLYLELDQDIALYCTCHPDCTKLAKSAHSSQGNKYMIYSMRCQPLYQAQEGGVIYMFTFLISVAASVTAYYICKWLDGEK